MNRLALKLNPSQKGENIGWYQVLGNAKQQIMLLKILSTLQDTVTAKRLAGGAGRRAYSVSRDVGKKC